MSRQKRFPEKLVVGMTPEMKEFLQEESRRECIDMNEIIRRAITEYKNKREK